MKCYDVGTRKANGPMEEKKNPKFARGGFYTYDLAITPIRTRVGGYLTTKNPL
jgi:hypothetical protein